MIVNDTEKFEILRKRSKKYAIAPEVESDESFSEFLEFFLNGERYAVENIYVKEVYPVKNFTRIPCTPQFILGVVNIRGDLISVTDIRTFLNLKPGIITDSSKIIILSGKNMEFAIVVDDVAGISKIFLKTIDTFMTGFSEVTENFIKGVTPERLIILDEEKLLTDKRLIVNDTL
ncbi:MAG TPA: chemotaxis protein CheW [Spirochaetota bacterium]|nr:chemotaxis protein CheW [Spirochaetota bacterium]